MISSNDRNLSVLRAVKLDYEPTLPAAEIDDKFPDRKLATKLKPAKLTRANAVPELLFGGSRIPTEYAC